MKREPPLGECCLLCRFWQPPKAASRGLCRLNPVPVETDSRHWCGHWRPRPEISQEGGE